MKREIIRVEPFDTNFEKWGAPVSTCTRAGDMIFISGMPPFDPKTGEVLVNAPFELQAERVLEQLKTALEIAYGLAELPPGGGITYVGHVDPSGGSADSFTLAVAHVESDGLAVLAQYHGVPMYVAVPNSTIDRSCPDGASIPIERIRR